MLTKYSDGPTGPDSIKDLIMRSLDADKATDIECIDLRGQTDIADYMVVASGTSSRHISALADKVSERLKAAGLSEVRMQGQEASDWVVVDAGDVIIHLFRPEVRSFYNLEKMWQTPRISGIEVVHA